jgi:DGQHR domain-containing protein
MTGFDQPLIESEYGSLQEMFAAANEAAMTSFGRSVSGILYRQGGRRFISAGLPVKILLSLAKRDSTLKKGDPAESRNRPLDNSHVKDISKYLTNEDRYLLPPIMLNASRRLQVFAYNTPAETKPCVFVLPDGEYLYVTDGQHRLEALKQALEEKPSLGNDSVGVTIVEEDDLDKVHQDFFDAAQVKPLAKALLVEYDGREPVNAITKDICAKAAIFQGRIERIDSVGKNSLMLFTNNQVKQGIMQIVVGDWSMYGDAMLKQTRQALEAAPDLWHKRVLAFIEKFTKENAEWNEVANRPLETGQITNIPYLREHYLHFSGAGLLILCGVGHAILALEGPPDGSLSHEQQEYIGRLASLDWSRSGALWSESVIDNQKKISAAKNKVVLAVAQAKESIGLPLSPKEIGIVQQAQRAAEETDQTVLVST